MIFDFFLSKVSYLLWTSIKTEEQSVNFYNNLSFSTTFFSVVQNMGPGHLRQYPPNPAMVMKSIINMSNSNGMMARSQLATINQSQLNTQNLSMAGPNITHTSPSPPASKSATPSPSSSINEDEQDDSNRVSS